MQYVDMLNGVSLGWVLMWTLCIGFLGGCIHKWLEKYRKYKNGFEEKEKSIEKHEKQIESLDIKVNSILDSVKDIIEIIDERESRRLRREILKFSDKLRSGDIPSRDAFRDIIESNQEYERLVAKTGCPNGYTEAEMEFVRERYKQLYANVGEE